MADDGFFLSVALVGILAILIVAIVVLFGRYLFCRLWRFFDYRLCGCRFLSLWLF